MSEMFDKDFNKPIKGVAQVNVPVPRTEKKAEQPAQKEVDSQLQAKFYDGQGSIVGKSQVGKPDNLDNDMKLFVALASSNPKRIEQASLLYEKLYEELKSQGDNHASEKAAYAAYGMFMKEFSKEGLKK